MQNIKPEKCIHFDTLNVSVCEGFINIRNAQYHLVYDDDEEDSAFSFEKDQNADEVSLWILRLRSSINALKYLWNVLYY